MSDYSQLLQRVSELFRYEAGTLVRIQDHANTHVGDEAGWITRYGYRALCIDRKCYLMHKLIYLLHHKTWPKVLDHINGNKLDNRIENLRPASVAQNCWNQKIKQRNTSGCKNVSWNKARHKWAVRIRVHGKVKQWYVADLELADLLAHEARTLYHGAFANHG